MPHRHGRVSWLGLSLVLGAVGCDRGGLAVPEPEVGKPGVTAKLPDVPAFDLPTADAGSHSVKELHVKGRKLIGSEVTVKGFVTWAYDCPTAIREENETDKQVQDRIDADPTLCFRPKFYVGDNAQTSPEQSLWIVDVPRPYNKLEMERMKKPDRTLPDRCEPKEDPKKNICPPYKVGDQVEITGKLQLSDHGDVNSDGVLVFERMKNVTENWPPDGWAPPTPPPGAGSGGPPPAALPSPQDLVNHSKPG
jgi:hypothetical protein